LFIINPFGYSPLTGLLVFNTNEPCKVKYVIKGRRNSGDYTNCDETLTKKHQVPVLGMYDGCINTIIFYLLDANNNEICQHTARIRCSRVGTALRNSLRVTKFNKNTSHFLMATGGYSSVNYAFDSNGNIRWYLTMPVHPYGVHMLSNGHMLVPDKRMRRPNYGNAHSVIAYETDLIGRIHRNIYHPSGFHHWAISKENDGNILMATSSRYDTYMENTIDEIDKNTGEVLRSVNANHLFDSTYVTRYDWAHINAFEYIPEEDAVIASYRNIHTIAKINLKNNEIDWLLANPAFYENTGQAEKVLTPGKDTKWFFQQHGVKILEKINGNGVKKIKIALFDNHTANRRPVDYFDNVKKSNLMVFTIDEINMSAHMDKSIPVPLSITRSNIGFDQKNNYIYAMCANIKDEETDSRAKILGFDYNTNECVTDISCANDFFVANFMDFNLADIKSTTSSEMPLASGNLYQPVAMDSLPDSFDKDKLLPANMRKRISFSLNGNILQITCKDHTVKKVYLYNDSNIFVQDFDDTTQLNKIFKEHVYTISIPLENIDKGTYQIGIEYF
ncbi:MAG: aryl-sulfate sulfotransferase, partial [Lachnospiraceae bacterium]|nr:aryl-sulfate sulfotransferase [Lachnospiraceae bacterium]